MRRPPGKIYLRSKLSAQSGIQPQSVVYSHRISEICRRHFFIFHLLPAGVRVSFIEGRGCEQIIGHIADLQNTFCSAVMGEKNPDLKIEKTKTTKPELIAALKESYAYCDKAYNDLTDATAAQLVKHNKAELPKLFLLNTNVTHAALHYGNLVTYMRLKNIVPPSSER